jgi:hypothetical protein
MKSVLLLIALYIPVAIGGENMGLHPEFPVVNGTYQMTEEWAITLNEPHNRRIEDGSLVIWRPGFTVWVNVWGNDNNKTITERAAWLKEGISQESFELEESKSNSLVRIGYRINEKSLEGTVYSYNGFAINSNGYVQISIYFDAEGDAAVAKNVFNSLSDVRP